MKPVQSIIANAAGQTAARYAINLSKDDVNSSMTPKVFTVLSIDELGSIDFEPPFDCMYFSWSPKKAFDARASAEAGTGEEFETLHTYLTRPD